MFKKLLALVLVFAGVFTLTACNEPEEGLTDAEKVAEAKAVLLLTSGQVVSDVTLPTGGLHDVEITWESSDESVIATDGTVTRPSEGEGNANVTLTATITIGDASDTKEFDLIVKAEEPSNVFDSIDALHEESSINDIVEFQGIVVTTFDGGYFMTDGQYSLGIYAPSSTLNPEVGDEVYVKGTYAVYNTLYQISDLTQESIESSDNTVDLTAVEKTVAEMLELDSSDPLIHGLPYTVTGTVELRGDYDNVYLVDGDDALLVYYYSLEASIEALEAEVGKEVTVTVYYYTDHGTNGPMVAFDGGADDIEVSEMSDADALEADLAFVENEVPGVAVDTIDLPDVGPNGTTFTNWASDNTSVLANDGTFVARGSEEVTVTFTADATKGSLTETVSVEVIVPVNMTAADALAADLGDYVEVTGTVYAEMYYGFFIASGGSYIFVYDNGYDGSTFQEDVANGDEITVIGATGEYSGLVQIYPVDYTVGTSGNAIPTPVDTTVAAVANDLVPRGTIATVTGTVSLEGEYDDVMITGPSGEQIKVYYRTNADEIGDNYVGDIITVDVIAYQDGTVLFLGTDADGDIQLDDPQEFSDAETAQAILDSITLGDLNNVIVDLELPTEVAGNAITWASDNTDVIEVDGTVNRVAGSDTTVTLTAEVTVGAVTLDRTFDTVVIDLNDSDPMTVADVLLEEDGTTVLVEGVITGFYYDSPFIQDADGTAIFLDDDVADVAIGDHIVVSGVKSTNTSYGNNQPQLYNVVLVEVVSSDNDVFVKTDVTAAELAENHGMYSSQRLTVDLTVAQLDDGFGYVFFEGLAAEGDNDAIFIKFSKSAFAPYFEDIYVVGDTLTITFNVYDMHYDNVRITEVVMPELTEEQKLDIVEGILLEDGTDVTVSETVELPTDDFVADYGVTISWASSDETVFATDGTVTQPAIGEADATVTVTATLTIGTTTRDVVFTVTVPAEVESVAYDYTENFSTFVGSGSSYVSETFVGDSGFSWDVTDSRKSFSSYEIDGAGIMFRVPGTMTATTVTGGIGQLTLDIRMGFTGGSPADRTVEIYVNDILVGSHTLQTTDTVETLVLENIDVAGDFKLEIVAAGVSGRQIVINNLQWTSYTAS